MDEVKKMSVQELSKLNQHESVDLIDVRTPAEFRQVHATIARNVPLDSLDPCAIMSARNGSADEPLYVLCQSGKRSSLACGKFTQAGFTNIVEVEGGTSAWVAAGLPVVRGKKTISLERQVRITAGFLVLLGAVLSFIHPAFIALSAFVGAGLMHSGITDSCAMGMLMAKMPWNQVQETAKEDQACTTA